MKSRFLNMIKQYKFRSLFTTVLLSMILLSLLLTVVFASFFSTELVNATRSNRMQENEVFLDTGINNIDYLLINNLHQSIVHLSNSTHMFKMAFSTKLDTTRIFNASVDMANAVIYNDLLEYAFVYFKGTDYVIGSDYKEYKFNDCPYLDIINAYTMNETNTISIKSVNRTSHLFQYNDRYMIALEFPLSGSHKLATIFCFINMDHIYMNLVSELEGHSSILVYDAYYQPVFSSSADYPETQPLDILQATSAYSKTNDSVVFRKVSPLTGWIYLYSVDESAFSPSVSSVLSVLLPIILFVFVASAVLSVFISRRIYRPVQNLMEKIDSHQNIDSPISHKNEIDTLSHVLYSLETSKHNLQSMITGVSTDIMTHLFLDIFSGIQRERAQIEEILLTANTRFEATAPYTVYIATTKGSPSQADDQRIAVMSMLQSITDSIKDHNVLLHIVPVNISAFAIVLSTVKVDNVVAMKQLISKMDKALSLQQSTNDVVFEFAHGKIYYSILDVGFSFNEAERLLKTGQLLPAQTTAGHENAEANLSQNSEVSLKQRAQQVIDMAAVRGGANALVLVKRICQDIASSEEDTVRLRNDYEHFISALIDGITTQKYISLEITPDDIRLRNGDERDSLVQSAAQVCENIILKLTRAYKKHHNKYIVAARDFIAENYSDNSLSLSYVAEAVETNKNYLSKLFKDCLGVYFSDYLNNFRIEQSLRSLISSSESINDIALNVGFTSSQSYIRVFKKYMGVSPGIYRKEHRN